MQEASAIRDSAVSPDTLLIFAQNQELLMRFVQASAQSLSGQASAQEALQQAQRQSPFK